MPSYRPPISRDQFKDLEVYFFRLIMFTDSVYFRELSSPKMLKIRDEIVYISMTLDILSNIFSAKEGNERPVMAWKDKPRPNEVPTIYRFSSAVVAARVLDCNASKIGMVCAGTRKSTGGWWEYNKYTEKKEYVDAYVFQYEEDYLKEEAFLHFNPDNPKFEFYGKEDQSIIETDGIV